MGATNSAPVNGKLRLGTLPNPSTPPRDFFVTHAIPPCRPAIADTIRPNPKPTNLSYATAPSPNRRAIHRIIPRHPLALRSALRLAIRPMRSAHTASLPAAMCSPAAARIRARQLSHRITATLRHCLLSFRITMASHFSQKNLTNLFYNLIIKDMFYAHRVKQQ